MAEYSLAHLSDADLTRDITALVTRDRVGTALLLAHLAEFDARKLFRPAGYSSMFAYCVGELHFSEPEASRRIQAGRLSREFPLLLAAVAAGRLHLSGICLLSPHLTNENAEQLIEAATHRSKRDIELLLAGLFPDALPEQSRHALIRPVRVKVSEREPSGAPLLELPISAHSAESSPVAAVVPPRAPLESTERDIQPLLLMSKRHKEHLPGDVPEPFESPHGKRVESPHGKRVESPLGKRGREEPGPTAQPPTAPEHFLLRLTIRRSTHDKLRELQALLSHAVPGGEVAEVLDRAFDLAIVHLKRRKFGIRAGRRVDRPGHRGHSPAR